MLHAEHDRGSERGAGHRRLETLEPRVLLSASINGEAPADLSRVTQPAAILAPDASNTSDFDDDGDNDLVFRSASTGRNAVLLLENGAPSGTLELPRLNGLNWDLVGVADFDGDGDPDLLLHNENNRRLTIWRMEGTMRVGSTLLPPAWAFDVAGVADFTTDGTADIALMNRTTRRLVVWELDNAAVAPGGMFAVNQRLYNQAWEPAGAGDFDADGDADLLFRHQTSGRNVYWEMNDTLFIETESVPSSPNLAWRVGDVKDYDGDGEADISWRNSTTERNSLWVLDDEGSELESARVVPGFPSSQWAPPYYDAPSGSGPTPRPYEPRETSAASSEPSDLLVNLDAIVTFAEV